MHEADSYRKRCSSSCSSRRLSPAWSRASRCFRAKGITNLIDLPLVRHQKTPTVKGGGKRTDRQPGTEVGIAFCFVCWPFSIPANSRSIARTPLGALECRAFAYRHSASPECAHWHANLWISVPHESGDPVSQRNVFRMLHQLLKGGEAEAGLPAPSHGSASHISARTGCRKT
jgi:hypothetical protein